MNTHDFEMRISAQHPAFAGHFPGNPVLPGAMLLSLLLQTVMERPALASVVGPAPQIDQVKFLAPVGPGQLLHGRIAAEGGGLNFELHCAGRPVLRGRLSPAALKATAP